MEDSTASPRRKSPRAKKTPPTPETTRETALKTTPEITPNRTRETTRTRTRDTTSEITAAAVAKGTGRKAAKKTSASTSTVRKSTATQALQPEPAAARRPRSRPKAPAEPQADKPAKTAADPKTPRPNAPRAAAARATEPPGGATEPPEIAPGELERAAPQPPRSPARMVWARIVADPGYAAEHAAREAVHRLGPEARDWVARVKDRYPAAQPDGIARLATREAARAARRHGAVSGAAGVIGSVADAAVLARCQARVVLTIAAAYGVDPTSDERTRDLLELLRVPRPGQPTLAALRSAGRLGAGFAVRRFASRAMPFGAAVVGAIQGGRSMKDVAVRATAYYRGIRPQRVKG